MPLSVSTIDTVGDMVDTGAMAQRDTMNVSVSPEHKAFVKGQVASGRFRNDSEVVREGLRLLEDRDRQRQLEEKLLEGLDGGGQIEMDGAFWDALRRRVSQQARRPNRGTE